MSTVYSLFSLVIRIFEADSNILSLVGRKYSSELDIFHSFIRIFEVDSNILSLVGRKYSSRLDIFSLVYSYI